MQEKLNQVVLFSGDILAIGFIIAYCVYAWMLIRKDPALRKKYRTAMIVAFLAPFLVGMIFKYFLLVPMPVAQVGISGSVRIGREVMIGGKAGFADHVQIGDKAMIGGGAGIIQNISPGDIVSGSPAMPHRLWLKTSRLIKRLPQFNDRIRTLEKEVDELKRRLD